MWFLKIEMKLLNNVICPCTCNMNKEVKIAIVGANYNLRCGKHVNMQFAPVKIKRLCAIYNI